MVKQPRHRIFCSDAAIISYFAIIKILIHLINPEYGYHRDELYYIAISDHFSFANLDMLPLSPLYLKLVTTILGHSIKAIHFASSLCGAIVIVCTCLITRELGGRGKAVFVTGLCTLLSGFIIFGALFSYDSLDFLVWVLTLYLLVRIFKTDNQKLWLLIGIVLGLGLLNKLTILFFGLSIFVSLWFVPQRAYFKKKWVWIAGLLAILFIIPYVLWQSQHHWYFLDFARGYAGGVSYIASFPEFVWNQILPNNPFNFPLWLTGLVLILFSSKWKQYRFFGFNYCFLFLLFFVMGTKFYFLMPLYAILISIGSIKVEEICDRFDVKKQKTKIIMTVVPIVYVLFSFSIICMAIPVLPVEYFVEYAKVVGVDAGVRTENLQINQLPQHFADRFGWEEMVQDIADVYDTIPLDEKSDVGILTGNWGQASAVHLYRQKYDLPEAITNDGWYYFEALRTHVFKKKYVAIGIAEDRLKNVFETVNKAGFYSHPYCIPHENNKTIYLCSKLKYDLRQYWIVEGLIDSPFFELVRSEGVEKAIAYYHNAKKSDPAVLMFTERHINALGYRYLRDDRVDDAIKLFKLNVEVYPSSWNVYDSLGEGYMEKGNYNLALEYYKKSLALNPDNTNGVEMLEKIEKRTME